MIDIYTEKRDSNDWILQNDLYFNLNTGNEEMSQKEINLIQQVYAANMDWVQSAICHLGARHFSIL